MKSQSGTSGWRIWLGLFIIAICVVAYLTWESRGRPGISGGKVSTSDETDARFEVYRRLCEGKRLAGEGKHAEALAILDEIARTEAGSSYGWDADTQAAHSMGYVGRHEEALTRCDRIIADCPLEDEVIWARLTKADIYSLAGQHDVAIKLLEKLIVENTNIKSFFCEEALVGMTTIYKRTGQYGLVRAVMERIAADYPGDEATRRKWAMKAVNVIKEKSSKQQEPRIEELLTQKGFQNVKKLAGGPITWTAENGPYLVTQPILVGPNDNLRIEAGTQVRFGVLGGLRIEGKLEVAGTAEKPVELTALNEDTTRNWWMGLELVADKEAGASKLTHCRLMGANIGVEVRRGLVEIDHCIFDRCGRAGILVTPRAQISITSSKLVDGYRVGVECERRSVLQMTDCQLTGLTTYGITLKEISNESFIRQTRIERCGWDGMFVRGKCSPTINNCRISNNDGNGIYALEEASPKIAGTRVENNTGIGIRLKERWDSAIRGNTIINNNGGGIVAEVRCNGEIVGNRVENNGKVGLLLNLDCAPSITKNRFVKNKGPGLLLQNSQPAILRDNQFIDNTEAALRNEGTGTVQAANNWWGTTDEKEIAKLIQDHASNNDWGKVEFRPWLTEPPALNQNKTGGQ